MKIIIRIAFALFLIGFISCDNQPTATTSSKTMETKEEHSEKVLRHVVLFSFKEEATQADITKVQEAFSALPSKIPQIQGYEWGLNNSPEGLNKGLTHCFLLTFKSEEDRAIYLPHPDHKAFGAVLGPHLEDVLVVDYWTE